MMSSARVMAKQKGEKVYQGKVCTRGHSGVRYTKGGKCVDCTHENNQALAKARCRERIWSQRPVMVFGDPARVCQGVM